MNEERKEGGRDRGRVLMSAVCLQWKLPTVRRESETSEGE